VIRRLPVLGLLCALAAACAPRLEPAGPPVAAPAIGPDAIVAADGARLPLRVWKPEGPPAAVILALHGFNDYSRAFEMPAPWWAGKHRIATYAYDQRGFGAAPNRGLWAGYATMADDAAAAARLLRERHPGIPLIVLGESMGGAIAMIAAADRGLAADALILVAPALRGRPYLGAIPRAALWLAAHTIPWYPLTGQGLGIQASDNIEMLRALGRDPLYIRATRVDAIHGLVDAMDAAIAATPRVRIPALVLYGTRDELIPAAPTRDLIRNLPATANSRPAVYRTGWHLLLRDLKAEIVLRDIAAWIADGRAPLPSGADRQALRTLRQAEAAQ
jgi:acylglycerol lipase